MLETTSYPIDRQSKLPLYYQLKQWLMHEIDGGELEPGSQIPSESSLCSGLSVSRTVVRQALSELVSEGYLYRVHGVGTFVRDSPVEPAMAQTLASFAEDMQEQRIPFTSEVLSAETMPAAPDLASRLEIAPGAEVVRLERLGSVKGSPFVLTDTYLPYGRCPGILDRDLTNLSLYQVLERAYDLVVVRARRTLEPALINSYEAEKLQIPPDAPIHLMRSTAYLASAEPIEFSKLRFRGDRSRFVFTVFRPVSRT
jgi:GntR family transcriptional regulator